MNFVIGIFDFILHIDVHLSSIIGTYGALSYLILFLIIFCETGLVVAPFLPGDSLIFAAGAFCAMGALNVALLFILLALAAIVGDAVNYLIGNKIGQTFGQEGKLKFVKQRNIDKTVAFFDKHGGKTIVIARFIPIIRTFAPFVAGAGKMNLRHFLFFNAIGGLLWVALFSFGGYLFGNVPIVKENFSIVIMAIILISLAPVIILKYTGAKQGGKEK